MDINLTLALLLFFPYLTRASVLGRDEAEENGTGDLSGLHGDLAFSLFRALADNRPHDNVLFSPFAVSSALAFLSRGSGSQTQTEILSALGISDGDSVERACLAWRDLVESLTEIHLATGTSLHVERSSLSSKTQDRSWSSCDGDLRPVDFSTPQQVKENINSYVEKETMGNITDFFQSISISAKTVLANYMYFKGKWEKPFVWRHTVSWRFQVNGSLAVEVPMMFS
ncbi:hypothetical protein GJAV_G00109690 [Gymnothorax javanicus]|nr:hypothetical protein GJAV_G00109690 [Gymnothorax javanicus]